MEQVVALNLPESLLSLRTGSTVYSETLTTHTPTPYCDYEIRGEELHYIYMYSDMILFAYGKCLCVLKLAQEC